MTEPKTEHKSFTLENRKDLLPWLSVSAVVALTVFQLNNQGRIWWCGLGDYTLWSNDAWGSHNSQHLFDPYSPTHALHGILFFWLVSLVFKKTPVVWQITLAIFLECAWEILENTNAVIEHYRTATLALNYYGDSIFNSAGDIFSCAIGFAVAYKLRFRRSLLLFLLIETILLVWIHDSLLLNIVMLIHPVEAVKTWQSK